MHTNKDNKLALYSDLRHLTQQSLKSHKMELSSITIDSPKVIIQKRDLRTSSAISAKRFFGYKRTENRSSKPCIIKIAQNVKNFTFSPIFNNKKISNLLLDGSETETRLNTATKNFRSGKIKIGTPKRKNFHHNLLKASVFDSTVPDSIIIYSHSPPRNLKISSD